MKINFDRNYKIILFLIIILGLGIRLFDINKYVLWQDEAETVINTIQVIEDGYPHGYFKGRPIFENASFIEIDDPVYKYASTNYYGSKYENNKGWLTYFYLAPFIKMFGFSEASARIPFLLFYVLTSIFIFLFSKLLFKDNKVALLAVFFMSIDTQAILYGTAARYYALLIFLTLLVLYLNYLYIQNKKNRDLFWLSTSLILLFHVHIVAFVFVSLYIFIYDVFIEKIIKWNKPIFANLFYILILTIPWLILVKFWVNFQTHDSGQEEMVIIKPLWLFFIVISSLFISIYRRAVGFELKVPKYILYFIFFYVVFIPLITPSESFGSRVFMPLLPLFHILFGWLFFKVLKHKLKNKHYSIIFMFLILLYAVIFFGFKNFLYHNETNWIRDLISYAQETNLQADEPIFLEWQDLVVSLYSDYTIYKPSTINTKFFMNQNNRFLFVLPTHHINSFYKTDNEILLDRYMWLAAFAREKDYYQLAPTLQDCDFNILAEHVLIFDCQGL